MSPPTVTAQIRFRTSKGGPPDRALAQVRPGRVIG